MYWLISIEFYLFPKVNYKFGHKNIMAGMVTVGHIKMGRRGAMNFWFQKFCSIWFGERITYCSGAKSFDSV